MNFSEKLIDDYEKNANKTLAAVCRFVAVLMFLIGMLNFLGVFVIDGDWMYTVIASSIVIALLPTLVFDILEKNEIWAQYIVLIAISLMCAIMYAVLSYHSIIMLVFPLVCSCLYGNRKWIIFTMSIMVPLTVIVHFVAFQLKVVPDEPLVTLRGVIFYGILPRLIQIVAIGCICIGITNKLRRLIMELLDKNKELYEDQQMLITSLSQLVEAQSQETGLHIKRVSEYTRILCEGMGYDSEETWKVSIASMMHDVGKLLVPSEIIEKRGSLTEEEFEQVKKHVDYGKQMLDKSPGEVMQLSAIIAYQHHEKWDGSGYKHMAGEEIAANARIVAIADVFDALVSTRPYKEPWTAQEAYDEIVSQSGSHFDPELVEVFKKNFSQFEKVLEKYPDSGEILLEELITYN